jgi:3-hydroxyacyl-CoA dehydrogenase
VTRAAVIGAGTMGGGIAMCFANAGIPVTLVEASAEALARGLDTVGRNYRSTAARGALAAGEMEARLGRIAGTTDLAAVAAADIVIEAVFEDMDIKRGVFADLDRIAKSGAVLASNTSYLDIDALARGTRRPQAVVGMHFFSPANVMRLIEVVRGAATAPQTLATAIAVSARSRPWSGCATASSATACCGCDRSRRSACSLKARCLRTSMPRSPRSAFPWVRSPCRIWRVSTSAGACARRKG